MFLQVRAQELRQCYRESAQQVFGDSREVAADLAALRKNLPEGALVDDGENLRLPFTPEGLKVALLNAERWGGGGSV